MRTSPEMIFIKDDDVMLAQKIMSNEVLLCSAASRCLFFKYLMFVHLSLFLHIIKQTSSSYGLIALPHGFEHPLRWYYQLQEIKKYYCGLGSSGIIFKPKFMKILSRVVIWLKL
jgi:hypothetical protein